ncbi:hypothetical protein DXG01_012699, partial [Tephrocybe rancida]
TTRSNAGALGATRYANARPTDPPLTKRAPQQCLSHGPPPRQQTPDARTPAHGPLLTARLTDATSGNQRRTHPRSRPTAHTSAPKPQRDMRVRRRLPHKTPTHSNTRRRPRIDKRTTTRVSANAAPLTPAATPTPRGAARGPPGATWYADARPTHPSLIKLPTHRNTRTTRRNAGAPTPPPQHPDTTTTHPRPLLGTAT